MFKKCNHCQKSLSPRMLDMNGRQLWHQFRLQYELRTLCTICLKELLQYFEGTAFGVSQSRDSKGRFLKKSIW